MSDSFTRLAAKEINGYLGAAVLSLAMLILLMGMFFLTTTSPIEVMKNTSTKSYVIIFASGLVNGLAWFWYFRFLASGGTFTEQMPIIFVLLSVFVFLSGVLIWKDPVSIKTILGLAFGMISIYLLAG